MAVQCSCVLCLYLYVWYGTILSALAARNKQRWAPPFRTWKSYRSMILPLPCTLVNASYIYLVCIICHLLFVYTISPLPESKTNPANCCQRPGNLGRRRRRCASTLADTEYGKRQPWRAEADIGFPLHQAWSIGCYPLIYACPCRV